MLNTPFGFRLKQRGHIQPVIHVSTITLCEESSRCETAKILPLVQPSWYWPLPSALVQTNGWNRVEVGQQRPDSSLSTTQRPRNWHNLNHPRHCLPTCMI